MEVLLTCTTNTVNTNRAIFFIMLIQLRHTDWTSGRVETDVFSESLLFFTVQNSNQKRLHTMSLIY